MQDSVACADIRVAAAEPPPVAEVNEPPTKTPDGTPMGLDPEFLAWLAELL